MTTPQRFIDYNVYPPSATTDREGWAVTIRGQYIEGKRFDTRAEAEAFARHQLTQQQQTLESTQE